MKRIFLSAFLLILFVCPAFPQEFYAHYGLVHKNGSNSNSTGGYGVSYFHQVGDHVLASLSYINQGHFAGHHRDGLAPQVWWRQMLGRHFSLSAGLGPFIYFDTTGAHGASLNNHGVGGILSAAATWHTDGPFLIQLRTNWVQTAHSIDTTALTLALGYRLETSGTSSPSLIVDGKELKNEITFFAGKTVLNQFQSTRAVAGAIEYRRNLNRRFDWTFAVLYEGDVIPIRRVGPVAQLWLGQYFYGDRLSLGAGAGPYLAFDKTDHGTAIILTGPVVTLTGAYRFTPHWGLRLAWNRVTTAFDHDTDVFMGGISYRF